MANLRTLLMPVAAVGVALAIVAPALAQGVPVQPGNASAENFRPSTSCKCHSALTSQWRQSMHAQALTDPVFRVKVAEAAKLAGPDVAVFCKRCHSPIGNLLGDPDGGTYLEAAEGVTCMFCHQLVGNPGAYGNTSQLIVADLTRRAQLKRPRAPHRAAYSAFYMASEFCGGCHNLNHPTNGLPLATTYTEWAASPYAKKGTQCQDCHMNRTPGVPGPSRGRAAPFGRLRANIYEMTFVGANVSQGPPDASREMLKRAAVVTIDAPEIVAPGASASVKVTVTNKGAGHDLPTGVTEERQMWLTVYTRGRDGTVTKLGERHFDTIFEDARGKHPAEVWDAVRVYSKDRIPAGGSASSVYRFKMPSGAVPSTVVAKLNYRSLPDELAVQAGVDNPTTEMASATRSVYPNEAIRNAALASQAPRAPAVETEPTGSVWPVLIFVIAFIVLAILLSLGITAVRKR